MKITLKKLEVILPNGKLAEAERLYTGEVAACGVITVLTPAETARVKVAFKRAARLLGEKQ